MLFKKWQGLAAFCLVICNLGAIHMDQPASGVLPPGSEQPSGYCDQGYQIDDEVRLSHSNYGMGFYNSGVMECDEYWDDPQGDFTNGGWSAENVITLQGAGYWTFGAVLWRGTTFMSADTHGGEVSAP